MITHIAILCTDITITLSHWYYTYLTSLHKHSNSLDIISIYTYYTWHIISCARITVTWMLYYTDTIILYSCTTDTQIHYFHWILSFHIFVSSLCGCSVHNYIMFIHHCHIDSPVYMRRLFLYSCCLDLCSYYMNYCYMDILVFSLNDSFPLLILISLLLDMCDVDMRCVKLSAAWF